jgi:hypothetical protein
VATTIQSVFAEPASDGDKSDFTAYGAATDALAVTKPGVRAPGGVPSTASGIRSSTHNQLDRFNFTVPTLPTGLSVNWVRVWAYYQAVPVNHAVAQNVIGLLAAGPGHTVTVGAGQTGWRVSGKHSPFKAGPVLLEPGATVTAQVSLTEFPGTAADTDITAVHMEFGLSSMEHVRPAGQNLVGAHTNLCYQFTHAGYGSLWEGWMAGTDTTAQRSIVKEMVQGYLELCRIFVPFGEMMTNETTVAEAKWTNFENFLEICREEGLRLVITGIQTFVNDAAHRPPWLDGLSEANRWATFRRWWDRCARACASSPAVVAYDLINEPFATDTAGTWYVGGPPYDWGSYLCLFKGGRSPQQVLEDFITNMRDISSVGVANYDEVKPRGVGIPITGSYGGATEGMSWSLAAGNQIMFPHLYLWANGSPAANVNEFAFLRAFKAPIIAEETGLIDSTYGEEQLIDFLKRLHQGGAAAVNGGWKGVFDSFSASPGIKHHQRLFPIVKGRMPRNDFVATRTLGQRVGQRVR